MRSSFVALATLAAGFSVTACSSSSGPGAGTIVHSGGSTGSDSGGATGSGGATSGSGGGAGSGGAATGSGGSTITGTGGNAAGGAGTASGGAAGGQSASGGGTPQGGMSGATGGAGGGAVAVSEGCGMMPPTATGMIGTTKYGKFSMTITAESALAFTTAPGQNKPVDRLFYVRLPDGYDRSKPYRVIYVGPGCSPTQDTQTTPKGFQFGSDIANSMGARTDAIIVQMEPGKYNPAAYNMPNSMGNCFIGDTSGCNDSSHYCFDDWASGGEHEPKVTSIADGPMGTIAMEKAYFDALHKKIEASYCVDKSRQFYAGYSSGGWMAQQLGCWFPDVLRAQANVTGGSHRRSTPMPTGPMTIA